MNFTKETFIQVTGEDAFLELKDILMVESTVTLAGYYSGYFIFTVNLIIFVISCLLYWNRKTRRPSLMFVANLSLSDTILSLTASLTSRFWLEVFKTIDEFSTEVGGKNTDSDRDTHCRISLTLYIFSMGNTICALALLTVDRYIGIKHPLRYPAIMNIRRAVQMIVANWIFWLTMSSITYSILYHKKNHTCTYVFSLSREYQLIILVLLKSVLITLFVVYRKILREYYKKKKHLEALEEEMNNDSWMPDMSAHGTRMYVVPVRIHRDHHQQVHKEEVSLKSLKHIGDDGNVTNSYNGRRGHKRGSSISKSLAFHIKYMRSSRYVLVILISFCIFHAPILIFADIELVRLYIGYYDYAHLENCRQNNVTHTDYHWFSVQDFYIGDCLRLLALKEDDPPTCTLPDSVDINSSQFCHIVYQGIEEIKSLSRTSITYWVGMYNSAVNPVLYAIWYRPFREGAMQLLMK